MPSSQYLSKLSRYIPLWQRNIPPYRLHQKGDPQIRVFLPLFWMKMIKPKTKTPDNMVMFEIHHQMTRFDVKNYLENIYKVEVLAVRTQQLLDDTPRTHKPAPWQRETKVAHVTLKDGTFEYPNIFKDKKTDLDRAREAMEPKKDTRNVYVKDVDKLPKWFMQ